MSDIYNSDFINRLSKGVNLLKHRWGMSESANVRLLTLSENATFIVEDSASKGQVLETKIIVRVHRPNYHSSEEIASEIAWINTLRQDSTINIPAPLPLDDGSYIASFDDEGQTRHLVAFEFMAGSEPSVDDSLTAGFELLGKISAQLHLHASQWQTPENFIRKSWTFETSFGNNPLWGNWRQALGLGKEGKAVLESLCKKLESQLSIYGETPDRFGLVHADLRLANLLIDQNTLSVIDFDDCGFSWFMYDFASAISFYEDSPHVPDLITAWLKGYRTIRPLSQEHEAMIPTFILFRRLLLTAWIATHSETETAIEAGLEAYTKGTVELAQQYLEDRYLATTA
ncbi:phosphotransferase enzyme family protein [Marinomonas sp. GJ51-6]|uniref:phosphotransferase enzyme family protein n=1 Tax=Marinomonas sp. GJ51-6 TaxID=2992802 RepID=UPI002934117E|nr:phosphotransferase [Marinomonas sp. GJ51-6]WOD09250.1 phosphotransferase [Marinomonas sp. GJ51-6]